MNVLIIPGMNNSGPDHWQTQWERSNPNFKRVDLGNWSHPELSGWLANLDRAIQGSDAPVLVAHSLGCLLVAHWSARSKKKIGGAFLAAPPNPDRPEAPEPVKAFIPVPEERLPFPSLVIASSKDPYADIGYSYRCAVKWGSGFVNIGPRGHINPESGFGPWPEGLALLNLIVRPPGKS